MKLRNLLVATALMALTVGVNAQTKTMPKKPMSSKALPMRDPKTGRFMKKTMPARDPKTGRFIKTHAKTTKPGPAHDPKTGRFIKKG